MSEPWPISAPGLMMVIMPLGATRTQALNALASVEASAAENSLAPSAPSARQNDMPPSPASAPRRVIWILSMVNVMAQPSLDACSTAAMIL